MLTVEIITPERSTFSGQARRVSVPTEKGILGIGSGHIPLLATLTAGEVVVTPANGQPEYLAVAGGFLEVLDNTVRILADSALHAKDLHEAEIKQAIERAEAAKASASSRHEFDVAVEQIERNIARLKVARKHSHGGRRASLDLEENNR